MIFQGSATALITPFNDSGVNFDALKRQLDYQLNNGTAAIVALGTTGEPATMTANEKRAVIEFVVSHINGRVPVIVGVGTNSTATSIENAAMAAKSGADALLVVTPYYNKCTQKGLVSHYFKIADESDLPIIVYNVPGRTGVNILPETYVKLADHPNIKAIKEACGNIEQISQTAAAVAGKLDLYSGDDGIILPILALGGIGIISVVSNAVPALVQKLCQSYFDGNIKEAREIQFALLPLVKAAFCEVNPIPIKEAMNIIGLDGGVPRLPLTPMENPAIIKNELKKLIPHMIKD